MDSMIKMLGGALTPQIMGSLAKLTGESSTGTQAVANSAISSLVGALSDKGGTESGAQGILDMLNTSHNGVNIDDVAGDFAGILGDSGRRDSVMGAGDGILSALMPGNKMNGALDLITGAAGVKRGSSSMMMRLLAPLALGMLRRYVAKKGLGALGLSQFLGGQKDIVQQAGFNANDRVERTTSRVETDRRTTANTPEPKKSGGLPGWLMPLLGLLLLGLLGWWLFNNVLGGDEAADTVERTFCGEVTTLQDGLLDLPVTSEISSFADDAFSEPFDALTETFDNIGDIARKDDISVDALDVAWDALKVVVGDDTLDQLDIAIDAVMEEGDALADGQNCPIE